jgi:predicted SAM-dependent methyltransferase
MLEMTLRQLRDQWVPAASRYNALKLINPVLRCCSTRAAVTRRLARLIREHGVEFLDLGGWLPVEGYVTIHLSPVEYYGLPRIPKVTERQIFDERAGLPALRPRPLKAPAISLNFNILPDIPIADAAMRGINLSHFLEHFDLETGLRILRGCRRVLRPGGILRVSCPDLRKYAQAYIAGDSHFYARTGSLAFCNYRSLPTSGAVFAGKAYDGSNGHKWFYDAETVIALLKEAGFVRAESRNLHESGLPRIEEIEPAYRAIESFYVEAIA